MKKLGETELLKEPKRSPDPKQEWPTKSLWEPKVLFLLSLNQANGSLPGWIFVPFIALSFVIQLLMHTPAGRRIPVGDSLPFAYALESSFVILTTILGVVTLVHHMKSQFATQIETKRCGTPTALTVLFVFTLLFQVNLCTPKLLAVGLLLIVRPEQT